MKYLLLLLISILSFRIFSASPEVMVALESLSPEHPRLFLNTADQPAWREKVAQNPTLNQVSQTTIQHADAMLNEVPVTRKLKGRRMLETSRLVLKREIYLGSAYRLTGDSKYAQRGIQEMLTVSAFTDWNPSHFLDVAEMTAALAIGYDWFYHEMTTEQREIIASAIIEKGLKMSIPSESHKNGWIDNDNNWNQVCHAGMTLGALAVYERIPELATELIDRAVINLPHVLKTYAPDGAYVEGAIYWTYGTTFNVMFLDAISYALGTDFGLSESPGFLASADFMHHINGPSGYYFNYADSGKYPNLQPALFWMAKKRKTPYVLWQQPQSVNKFVKKEIKPHDNAYRYLPMLLFWAEDDISFEEPTLTHWQADSEMSVAFHRSDWSPEATYIAIKGGAANLNHAHMDVGSFVLDMQGLRWANDLGPENYYKAEQQGITLWKREQDSARWKIFRLGSYSHNVITIDGEQQRVAGNARIISSEGAPENKTVIDLSPVYEGQLASAQRSVQLHQHLSVSLVDQIETLDKATTLRWAMLTRAKIEIITPSHAQLTLRGKTLDITLKGLPDTRWQILNISTQIKDWESPNPNTRLLYFEQSFPASSTSQYEIQFQGREN